jgi:hypothetical protein
MSPKLVAIFSIVLMLGLILSWILSLILHNHEIVNYGLGIVFILFVILVIMDKTIYKKKRKNE